MIKIKATEEFILWLNISKTKNRKFYQEVIKRVNRVKIGNFGDYKDLKDNLFELRFFNKGCAGLRVYYTIKANGEIILLLTAGNKSSQTKDINKARELIIKYKEA
jgi:putative addiction module killer protein